MARPEPKMRRAHRGPGAKTRVASDRPDSGGAAGRRGSPRPLGLGRDGVVSGVGAADDLRHVRHRRILVEVVRVHEGVETALRTIRIRISSGTIASVRPKPETAALLAAAVQSCGPDRIRTGDLVLDRDVC